MAKENVTYSCGHEGRVDLFGKRKDRERRIDSLEGYGLCLECWQKKRQKDDKEMGIVALSYVIALPHGNRVISILALIGDTYDHKEVIKELGFSFGDIFSPPGIDSGWKGFRSWCVVCDVATSSELEQDLEKHVKLVDDLQKVLPGVSCCLRMEEDIYEQKSVKKSLNAMKSLRSHWQSWSSLLYPALSRGMSGTARFMVPASGPISIWMEKNICSMRKKRQV